MESAMAWDILLIGTLAGVLIVAAVTAVARILKRLASRSRQTRRKLQPVPVSRSTEGNRIAEAEQSAA
jgi:hypothetical protein